MSAPTSIQAVQGHYIRNICLWLQLRHILSCPAPSLLAGRINKHTRLQPCLSRRRSRRGTFCHYLNSRIWVYCLRSPTISAPFYRSGYLGSRTSTLDAHGHDRRY